MNWQRTYGIGALLLLLLALLALASLRLGSLDISWPDWWQALQGRGEGVARAVVWDLRLPRTLGALAAGMAMGIGGLLMQTLFRNPLAGPGILGITSGAGLGVAAVMLGGASSATLEVLSSWSPDSSWVLLLAASLGAGLVLALILLLSWRIKDPVVLLIVGVMVGQLTLALVSVWQYLSRPEDIQEYLLWSFGSFAGVTRPQSWLLLGIVIPLVIVSGLLAKRWDLLLLGETYARSLGLSTTNSRIWLIALTSLLAGAVTAFCGPIGFVGVAVPHLARGLTGQASHRWLVPTTALCGAGLMLACDLLARLPGSGGSVPLNAVTILIGAPVVITVLLRRSGYQRMW